MDERDVLRKAKEVLLERGWNQGSYSADGNGEGAVCLEGAVRCAVTGDPYGQAPCTGHEILDSLYALPITDIPAWNDHPTRTFTEVIDLLDRAIASLEPSKTPELVA